MSFPRKCHPHHCPFDSPACPEGCKCECKKIKPNCVSVTAQEAMNTPPMRAVRTTRDVLQRGRSTRERVFGMPYDPRRDLEMPSTREDVIQSYLRHNLDSMESRTLREYASLRCCQVVCECSLGPDCRCRKRLVTTEKCPYQKECNAD